MNLKALFADDNVFVKLLITAFIAVVCVIIFSVFAVFHNAKIMQLAMSAGLFVVPPIVSAYLVSREPKAFLAVDKLPSARNALFACVFMILAVPVINLLAEWNAAVQLPDNFAALEQWLRNAEDAAAAHTKQMMRTNTLGGLLSNIFLIALVPAIGEELFFRGMLQNYFVQWTRNAHLAVWLAAFIFSAFHLQFFGFLPRLLLGAYLGYLLVWSRSLWLPMLAHFVNNALAVIVYFLFENKYIDVNPDEIGKNYSLFLVIGNVLILILLVTLQSTLKKARNRKLG
jgi:membrane protease YdiL (CAAX protease family)